MVNGMTAVGETVQFAAKAFVAVAMVVGSMWFYATQCVYTDAAETSRPHVELVRPETGPMTLRTSARTHLDDVY